MASNHLFGVPRVTHCAQCGLCIKFGEMTKKQVISVFLTSNQGVLSFEIVNPVALPNKGGANIWGCRKYEYLRTARGFKVKTRKRGTIFLFFEKYFLFFYSMRFVHVS